MMTGKQMRQFRKRVGLTQDAFGVAIGYSRAPVIALETAPGSELRLRMELAVEALSVRLAAERGDASLLLRPVAERVQRIARPLRGANLL